jgi:hypothetical protein
MGDNLVVVNDEDTITHLLRRDHGSNYMYEVARWARAKISG